MHSATRCGRGVLLINPAGWQKESINLGLCLLAASLEPAGFDARVLDLNRYPLDDESLLDKVALYRPSLIGVSVKTATAIEAARIAALLRVRCPGARIVAGGPHVTLCAEDYLREFPSFDYALMGEAEESIVRLAAALDADEDIRGIPGLVYRAGGRIVANQWRPPDDLDAVRLPNLDAIESFSWDAFRYPIVTSRGCPFECIYCCVNKLTGSRKWRARSAENVVDELELVAREKGVTSFEIWDDNFTLDLPRAKRICAEIIRRNLKLSWYCHNGIRADRVDDELARLMARAGCTSIAFGIESGNPEVFASINKGEPLSAVVKAIKTVNKAGIKAVGYFIIGLPGDTLEKFVESVRFQRSLPLMHYVFGMLIPYPKTRVWDIVRQRGRMLCDIMETRHFSDGIVPVSFELPEFPQNDMVRAFYITKYFELYAAVERRGDAHSRTTVVYLATPPMLEHLPGMLIACGPGVRHVVAGDGFERAVRALPAFSQVDRGIDVSFTPAPDGVRIPKGEHFVIVGERRFMVRHLLLTNADIVLFDAANPLQMLSDAKRAWRTPPLVPPGFAALTSFAAAFPGLLRKFGARKVREAAEVRLKRRLDAVAASLASGKRAVAASLVRDRVARVADNVSGQVGEIVKRSESMAAAARALPRRIGNGLRAGAVGTRAWAKRVLRPAVHKTLEAAGAAAFLRLKARIYLLRSEKKKFPYDDYPSYM